jgi:hypothetical protein
MQNRVTRLFIGIATVWLLVGCGKEKDPVKSSTAQPRSEVQRGSAAETPAPNAAPPATPVRSEADMTATLAALTQAVRKYGAEKQSVPTSLSEVMSAGYITSLPSPPAGKKFAINRKLEVVLVRE